MSYPYAKPQPMDRRGNVIQGVSPDSVSIKATGGAPPAASSVISFNQNTTVVEITALNNSLAYRWGSQSVIAAAGATDNFDGIVPVNSTRRIVIPMQTTGPSSFIGGLNVQSGLYSTMAVIATGSVLTAINEF